MATVTVGSIRRESAGSNTLIIASLTGVSDDYTWASGLPNAVAYWCNATDDPTQTREKIDVTATDGDFTFYVGADGSRTCDLTVLSKC